MEKIDMKVFTTDKNIAVKFYNKVIGLSFKKYTKDEIVLKCDNCKVEITE